LASLVYLVYKKHEDKGFLLSIFVSAFVFLIPYSFTGGYFIGYFYGGLVITGFISGIVAGLFNEDMISAILSGVTGVFLGYLINPLFRGILWLYLFALYPVNYYEILSILFGGIGGLIGNQIKIRRKY
jgi:uncharacterized ion transporter superfamily protein YfcC